MQPPHATLRLRYQFPGFRCSRLTMVVLPWPTSWRVTAGRALLTIDGIVDTGLPSFPRFSAGGRQQLQLRAHSAVAWRSQVLHQPMQLPRPDPLQSSRVKLYCPPRPPRPPSSQFPVHLERHMVGSAHRAHGPDVLRCRSEARLQLVLPAWSASCLFHFSIRCCSIDLKQLLLLSRSASAYFHPYVPSVLCAVMHQCRLPPVVRAVAAKAPPEMIRDLSDLQSHQTSTCRICAEILSMHCMCYRRRRPQECACSFSARSCRRLNMVSI